MNQLKSMHTDYKMTLAPVSPETAPPDAKAVLDKALAQVGFIPNMYARMANRPALLDTYLHGYAAFRTQSGFSPVEQEVVFLTISRENDCKYCVAAHSFIADRMSKVPAEVTDALREGRRLPERKLDALARFATTMVAKRGLPDGAEVREFLAAGYEERHILDILLAISVKTISNYTNHLFQTPLDATFEVRRWTGPASM